MYKYGLMYKIDKCKFFTSYSKSGAKHQILMYVCVWLAGWFGFMAYQLL